MDESRMVKLQAKSKNLSCLGCLHPSGSFPNPIFGISVSNGTEYRALSFREGMHGLALLQL